ncbi:LysR family transcriptional regulator [Clostridium boliviensis]|uniref:LysR family transcriptional regulator n=1 Tax=Clostridium boliviensis TaxID=318465 RepID=A0ABU4GLD4_9CLOT|nr:LysR family transcriptional regulator [Clostridium boliviensis]MDW2798437.1 LysR family transcriptional regulator [Clostridium boliviensis]
MDFKKLRYFSEVARLKSFSKAAKVLYVSQTAISQQIAAMESELGVELFYRDKKNVRLTLPGEVFLQDSGRLLKLYENAVIKTREVSSGSEGMIKIGFFSMFDRDVIAPVLSSFHQRYPKVKLSIVQCNYEDMKLNILNGTIDIGFYFQMESEEIEEMKVYQTFPKLCLSRNHRLSGKTLIHPEDLKTEQVISYIKNKEQSDYYKAHHNSDNPILPIDNSILVENMDDAVMLVSMNAGVSFLPEISGFINHDQIMFISQEVEKVPFDVNAYWSKDNTNPVLSRFLEEIKEKYSL